MPSVSVLIVEPDPRVAADLNQRLRKMGYNAVGPAVDAEQAVERSGAVRPDLVIMDISLPGASDGILAANVIIEQYAVPVLFLTGQVDEFTVRRAQASGAFGLLVRPCEDSELQTAIETALSRHRTEARLRGAIEELRRALAHVRANLGPALCGSCRRVRADDGLWKPIDEYLGGLAPEGPSSCFCPECIVQMTHDHA